VRKGRMRGSFAFRAPMLVNPASDIPCLKSTRRHRFAGLDWPIIHPDLSAGAPKRKYADFRPWQPLLFVRPANPACCRVFALDLQVRAFCPVVGTSGVPVGVS
jgi:hypothetical protein